MHDPMTVAFEICRPWPRRSDYGLSSPRWRFRGRFWQIAGRRYYWPSLITVWHVEPGGHNSGEICKHYRRVQAGDGKPEIRFLRGWRWHVHHWRVQVRPLQNLRRWAPTRCTWCHGPSRKGDLVNHSHGWDGPRGRWWQGEPGLYHSDCSTVAAAHHVCLCETPATRDGRWGTCQRCGRFAPAGQTRERKDQAAMLTTVRAGTRPTPQLMAKHRAVGETIRATLEARHG